MAGLVIHNKKISPALARELMALCPFAALEYQNGTLAVNAGCKLCKLCVEKSVGAIELVKNSEDSIDKTIWRGVAICAETACR